MTIPQADVEEEAPAHEQASAAPAAGAALAGRLWHGLSRPWLLPATGAPLLLLLTAVWLLPQLPGQLRSEPAAAARWLANHSDAYGALGTVLVTLGAFDVMRSPLLRILLTIVGFLLFVHLADQIATALLVRRLRRQLAEPAEPGVPLRVPSPHPLYRRRFAQQESPAKAAARLESRLSVAFDAVQRVAAQIDGDPAHEETDEIGECIHFLALRAPWSPYLRALCAGGLLLAMTSLWLAALFGWSLSLTALAPGSDYRHSAHDLALRYEMAGADPNTATPVLLVSIGPEKGRITIGEDSRLRVGQADVRVELDTPALLVETADGRASLVRPGQSRGAAQAGLVFPAIGSEETLLLPEDGLGLRVVRSAQSAMPFQVEVYASDNVQPLQRIPLSADGIATIPMGDTAIDLRFTPLPSLAITVSHVPAPWLFWVALAVAAVGSIGFLRTPAFLLAQIGPWPPDRSVVVIQSQRIADLQQL